ncbi:MAG: CoA-binding protein [Deltaproteobacteria bacterium]
MTTRTAVEDFVGQQSFAIVGVSRQPRKFGTYAYKELKKRGYRVFPVNPQAETIEGDRCFPSLAALPEPVGGVLIVVPPSQTEQVVREAAAAGIKRVWMQQGAASPQAIQYCEQNGISEVHGECILMFAGSVESVHRFHRFVWKILGKLPKHEVN